MVLGLRPALLAIALALASCSEPGSVSAPPEGCGAADWRAIGRADGEEGCGPERLEDHRDACSGGPPPDAASWEAGRREGLRLYCTPENAFALGERGRAMRPVCPVEMMGELEAENQRGFEQGRNLRVYRGFPDDQSSITQPARRDRFYRPREPSRW